MKFTGERFIPTEQGRIRLEHYHRYAAVQDIVAGQDVLDLACGEGYGSSFMSDVARSIVGVDISQEAVQYASSTYQKSNLTFRQGSAIDLDFADAAFDVVVSFETIEHLSEQAQMLAEIRRVLRPEGLLVISSPNRPVYSEESGEHNEFHVKELDFNEFDELLKAQFPTIQYFGQRILMGSVIQPLEGELSTFRAWHDDGINLKPNTGHLAEPVYFVAICGARNIDLPRMDMSVLYPDKLDLVKHYVGFAKWAKTLELTVAERDGLIAGLNQTVSELEGQIISLSQAVISCSGRLASLNQTVPERDGLIAGLNQTVSELDGQIISLSQAVISCSGRLASLNQTVSERNGQISSLNEEVVRRGEWALRLDAELKEERKKLLAVTQSNSWRLTLPLREVRRWVSTPMQQVRKYTKISLRLAKRMYQSLPLSYQTKASHRQLIAKTFPRLLQASGSHPATIPAFSVPRPVASQKLVIEPSVSVATRSARLASLAIPVFDSPLVSVIIPIYGKIDYTLQCLGSIAAHLPQAAFEVIVVDDCSPDDSFDVLSKVKGIRVLRNEQNQGFIRSCNNGAKAAVGGYLYFLNNDTEVTAGWMDELLRTFSEFPGTGLAGSKLIYPDGRLQEAGGIIWQDGSAWNFGRFQDPLLPVYNYAREVDYCSGASIMVPKELFNELGGFDEHYLPAYCEDCDLALKIRDKGLRVIYQPLSTVFHYEGVTSGTDTSAGTKAYQIENTKKLQERWQGHLQNHQPAGVDVDNAKDRRATRRVLVIDHCTPAPNQDAGSLLIFNLLLLLREMDFQVTFIPEDNFLYMPECTPGLQRVGIEVLYGPYVNSVEKHVKEFGERYNLVLLVRPMVVERHISNIRRHCPQAKVLFHTVDLHFLRMSREAALQADDVRQDAVNQMKQLELAAIAACDASIVVSTFELEILRTELPQTKVYVFPLIMNVPGTKQPFSSRRDIAFVGGYQHTPNVDAVKYFVAEIMPLLRLRLPGVRFYAIGNNPPAEVKELAAEDVIITGFVEELFLELDKMRISVAPLRYGAGIKGKIGSAMAVGLPVVATSLAAEGMSLTDGDNIVIADGAERFAGAIAALYEDELLWNRISQKGINFAEYKWGAEAAWKRLSELLGGLNFSPVQNSRPLSLYGTTTKSALLIKDIIAVPLES